MGLLETGLHWLPGATEHVGKRFCDWLNTLLEAIHYHKMQSDTRESTRRSGDTKGQHGLTRQEVADREERDRARSNLEQTKPLLQRQWWTLSETEKWWVRQYRDGTLHRRLRAAKAKLSPVQAPPFHM